ncbi:MAG: hypothetical protein RBS39_13970 [Phycisphaerales bacterium]|jgi:hypothetical protein|nr:hypothetical protein [Phycisphaerales bacterium]
MPTSILRFYQRHKVFNINVNIIAAGLLAILAAKWPVKWISAEITSALADAHPTLVNVLTVAAAAVIDGIADVLIYYVLHWLANHWRPLTPDSRRDHADEDRKFFRNATLVQFERMALTPVYYGVACGLMFYLIHKHGLERHWAFVWGFMAGIFVTRILHTIYLLKFAPAHVRKQFEEESSELVPHVSESVDAHPAQADASTTDALAHSAGTPRETHAPADASGESSADAHRTAAHSSSRGDTL